ncbi:E3 ubiquitin-protein ligase TRIM71-like isoform X1 [Dendronephthya gigantea]|uniref:E3 ubiquitin-protein ligase TRIM71-like isoform X1 n=1 Tax=Dendronephthya gigantea TaxID=151771 RepID=UPI00106B9C9F|nr:E3 ubiquitin-protein ligase TRIM71-like isoform X1 [Dendronephthya gigantea]
MAASLTSSRSIVGIHNLLVCDICKKTISEPKKLSCSHSFCKACVENLTTQDEGIVDGECKKLVCPTCKTTTTLKPNETVSVLPDNECIAKLLTAVDSNSSEEAFPLVCSFCGKGFVLTICVECSMLFCHECHMTHERWPANKGHNLLSLSNIINRDDQKQIVVDTLRCTPHETAIPEFYCETCKELICIKCLASIHTKPGHNCIAIHEIHRKQRDAVELKYANINAMFQEGNEALESVKNNKANYEKTAEDIKLKHIAQKDKVMKDVEDRMNKILEEKIQEVDKVYDPACQSLFTQSEKISNYLEKVEKSLQRTRDVLENSKLEELLTAHKVIDEDIQMLQNEKPSNLKTFANPESCMEKLCFYNMFKKLAEDNCPPPPDPVTLIPDSVILKGEDKLIKDLISFLNNRESKLKLCYRASLHGWQSQKFHQLCDGKRGTVVLVKVGNWIFGGYTDQTWEVSKTKLTLLGLAVPMRRC